jgi:plastin-1
MENNPYGVDVKYIQTFKTEDYTEYEKIFRSVDVNKSGSVDKTELLAMLHNLGYRTLKDEDIANLLNGVDLNSDGQITFMEFLKMMKQFKDENKSEMQRVVTKEGKGLLRVGSKGKDFQYQSFSEEERTAFVKVINSALLDDPVCKKYLPIDPDTNDIFTMLKNGIILCKLINKAVEGTIDERVINVKDNMNVFLQVQNLNLAINAAKSIGCQIIGIYPDTFMDEKHVMILGLLWQVVKQVVLEKINLKEFPQLIRLLKDGEQLSDLLKLHPEELLLRWFNYHLKEANYDKQITNFTSDITDSEKYTILLNQLDKKQCDKSALQEPDMEKRAEKVLNNAKKLGAESYITPADIVNGNHKLNVLFTAAIFNACPGLDPPTEEEAYEAAKLLEDGEGAREERAFRMWINSLGLEGVNINNLYEECKSGVLLLKIIDKIKPGTVDWKKVDPNTKNPFKIGVNCQEVIDAAKKSKYSIVGIGGSDIREGNKKYILAIVWQLMRAHTLQIIGNKTEEDLLAWGNSLVGDEYKVQSLKDKKLSTSLFFIHIMAAIESRAINWDIVIKDSEEEKDKEMNAKYAISIARTIGALIFLTWEDITEVKSKLLLTFLASLFDVASNYKKK